MRLCNDLSIIAAILDNGIPAFKDKYSIKYAKRFPMSEDLSDELLAFSKAVTSNLLGGVGYFYGDYLVDPSFTREWDEDEYSDEEAKSGPVITEPTALLTATPSRSFLPRGFYW